MDLNGSAESQGDLVRTLETMVRIRAFENKLGAMFKKGQLPGFVHLSVGQEATAVGTCSELRPDDTVSTTHRGHGHMIAKGADLRRMMAEILGRTDGYCKGMGGSMHLMDLELGIIGANGIVGAGIGLATGAAIADQTLGRDKVNVVFFGDGASNSGIFFESMNLAAIWKLPVIFICENNGYTEWMRTEDITAGQINNRAESMEIPNSQIDGNDVLLVRKTVAQAVKRARAGEGPSMIEMKTYRWYGHNEGEEAFSGKYRPADELKRSAAQLDGKPAPAGHPKNSKGQHISATNGEALASAWIGAYCTNARHEGGRTVCDIKINSAQPDGASQDEINAAKQLKGKSSAPDVFDLGQSVALANTALFAPYKVSTFDEIPSQFKDADGTWVNDYGGYMAIGYDSSKVPDITSVDDLLGPDFKGKVALNGDPTAAGAAFSGVMMAATTKAPTMIFCG